MINRYPSNTLTMHLVEQYKGGYIVQCEEYPKAITQGDTLSEALIAMADCMEEVLANEKVLTALKYSRGRK